MLRILEALSLFKNLPRRQRNVRQTKFLPVNITGKILACLAIFAGLNACESDIDRPPNVPKQSAPYPGYFDNFDQDCPDIGRQVFVGSYDPDGLDRDGDGWGCESYG